MGIRDFFSKRAHDEVVGTKVLVASLDQKFAELVKADSHCYSQFYPTPTEAVFESIQELLETIDEGYDIVHLFCDLSPNGRISDGRGNGTTGTTLIQSCLDSEVKLLWLASGNNSEGYVKGFEPAAGKPLNLVLTIDRRGARFPGFPAETSHQNVSRGNHAFRMGFIIATELGRPTQPGRTCLYLCGGAGGR
ncbi:MAG: hypothetical protein ACHQT6_03975 [Candidatus Acidiferrales bacterium]